MSIQEIPNPSFRRDLLIVGMVLSVLVAAGLWIAKHSRTQEEAGPPPMQASTPVLSPSPVAETSQAECQRLWAAHDSAALIDAVRRWLARPAHPMAEVVAWMQSLPAGTERDALLVAIAPSLPAPQRVLLAADVTSSKMHRSLLVPALAAWATEDAAAALAWLDKHADDKAFQPARSAALTAWASVHPRDAAAYLTTIIDEAKRQATVAAMLRRWMPINAEAAATWVEILPGEQLQRAAAKELTSLWVQGDEAAAADWVEQLPTGALRDVGLATLAVHFASDDPSQAQDLAAQISDPRSRDACLALLSSKDGTQQ